MTPLAWCVIALAVGSLAGGIVGLDPEPAVRLALLAGGGLVLGARLAWGGHDRLALTLAVCTACGLGVGLGALAEARAWTPPDLDVEALERASAAGDVVRVDGVLRRDAWVSASGGVALDLQIRRVWWRGGWQPTSVGVRATVAGDAAVRQRETWSRGRQVETSVAAVRRPLPYRNFGVPEAERAMARRGLRLFATIKSASLISTTRGPWWEEAAARVRSRVRTAVALHVRDPVAAATVTAILIGDRSRLPETLVRDLQHAGVYHVVAISGGNVGIWLLLLMWLPRAAGLGTRGGIVWLASGLLAFAAVVDGGASVARAVTVAAVVIAARWWDVRVPAGQALLVAALVQVLADPLALHDPGCVLSFGAAGTLVAVSPWSSAWSRRAPDAGRSWWRRGVGALGAILGATLAVELVLLPITARWFSVATAAGLLANLLAVPAMGVVQVAGLGLIAAASLWPPVGTALGAAATIGVQALLRSADVLVVAPWLIREVPPPSPGVLAAYYAALATACAGAARVRSHDRRDGRERRPARDVATGSAVGRRASRAACAAGTAVAAATLTWIVTGGVEHSVAAPWTWPAAARWQQASWPEEPWLLISVLDVGQGDATVIRFPSGTAWLVDAGGSATDSFDVGERVTTPAIWALGHRRLGRVFVTHAHPDHAAGMPAVLRRLGARELVTGVAVPNDELSRAVTASARSAGIPERRVSAGESFVEGPVRVDVLHPERPDWERRRVRNDDSIVLWLRFRDVGVLLPGDVGRHVEGAWAPRIGAAPLTVVKLAHHGSASSTGETLIGSLAPGLAVASMARGNRFSHPSPAVLRRLADAGIVLLRTDQVGAIQLATNGRVLLVRTASGLQGTLTSWAPRRAWWPATPLPSARASPRRAADPDRAVSPPSSGSAW